MTLAWSTPTKGKVEGKVIILPDLADSAAFKAWLPDGEGQLHPRVISAADLPARFQLQAERAARDLG